MLLRPDRYAKALIREEDTRRLALREGLDAAGLTDPYNQEFQVLGLKESDVDVAELVRGGQEKWAKGHAICRGIFVIKNTLGCCKLAKEKAALCHLQP